LQLAEQQEKEEERIRAGELAAFHKRQTNAKNEANMNNFKQE